MLARLLREFRPRGRLRRAFFWYARDYKRLWNAFALLPSVAREAVLAGAGESEESFWRSGQSDAERYVLPYMSADSRVLDLGAGVGRVAKWVAPNCRSLILADVSGRMLARAKRSVGSSNATFVVTNGRDLRALADSSIDVAYSLLVFQHIEREDFVSYLDDLRRVLVPRGTFVFQIPDISDPMNVSTLVHYSRERVRSPARLRYYSQQELHLIVENLGYGIEREERERGSFYLTILKM